MSILLYHDFVERIPRTEMMVSVPTFRAQMQALIHGEGIRLDS